LKLQEPGSAGVGRTQPSVPRDFNDVQQIIENFPRSLEPIEIVFCAGRWLQRNKQHIDVYGSKTGGAFKSLDSLGNVLG
jgi:hypothetical protein